MTIDLTGIGNQNEFYTHHYLSAILEGDIRAVLGEWRRREQENKIRPPHAELRQLYWNYFSLRDRFARPRRESLKLMDEFGFVDVDRLCREVPRLGLVRELAERYRFLHWELEFADIFADRGGFDLVLGNPPWIKVEWNEGGVMGDAEPLFVLRNFTASRLAKLREETLEKYGLREGYLAAFDRCNRERDYETV